MILGESLTQVAQVPKCPSWADLMRIRCTSIFSHWLIPTQWGGHEIDLTLGHRYKKNPRYTNRRYLCPYCTLRVSKSLDLWCVFDRLSNFEKCNLRSGHLMWSGGVTFGIIGSAFFFKIVFRFYPKKPVARIEGLLWGAQRRMPPLCLGTENILSSWAQRVSSQARHRGPPSGFGTRIPYLARPPTPCQRFAMGGSLIGMGVRQPYVDT